MQRLRLYDFRMSDGPRDLGICQGDVPQVARVVNSAQRRLLMCREAGDEGWWGTWAEMGFTLDRNNPFITTPRHVARIAKADVCNHPIQINNQWGEYLNFGNGRMPQRVCEGTMGLMQSYTRNNVPVFTDFVAPGYIRVYTTNTADEDQARILVQGIDQYSNRVRSFENQNLVEGEFLRVTSPFNTTATVYSEITGFQKDVTFGTIQIFRVDVTTGAETLLVTMEPSETTAHYRRYYYTNVPVNCCNGSGTDTTVTALAICKLDLIPAQVDTDYLLIQNIEALIEESQSLRYSRIDDRNAKQMSAERHLQAVRLLQGELVHYLGKMAPAVNFAPFGSARLVRQRVGTLF